MFDPTPLERFQFKWAIRRERLLRKIRLGKVLRGTVHRELARRRLAGEMGATDFAALKVAQRFTPGNDRLRRMAEGQTPANPAYSGDDSWE